MGYVMNKTASSCKEICLPVTFKCNWNCDYCVVDTHSRRKLEFNRVLNYIDDTFSDSTVFICGGEPGLLKKGQLYQIINKLKSFNCTIEVNTNGKFFNHVDCFNFVDRVEYHCSENLDLEIIEKIEYPFDIEYCLVVTDDNIHKLVDFLNLNNHLNFTVYGNILKGISTQKYLKYLKYVPLNIRNIKSLLSPKQEHSNLQFIDFDKV